MNQYMWKKVLAVSLDLAKTFDSICHKTLMNKIKRYGFRGAIHQLLVGYLQIRKQRVKVSGCFSDHSEINYGVLHDYILGPLSLSLPL